MVNIISAIMCNTINIDNYPQLSLLAWNRTLRDIEPEVAFALYERNWRFVDTKSLTENEAALIDRLKNQYGKGVLNV